MNDPSLTNAIGLLRGEWAETSKSILTVTDCSFGEIVGNNPVSADLVVFSTQQLGAMCERDLLRPVRQGVLDSAGYDAADVFPPVRDRLLRYGNQIMALPLGVQVPLLCYRRDLVAGAPSAWQDYRTSRRRISNQDASQVVEPWKSRGAILLLARAAPLAVHARHEAVLFDPESMKPAITAPPFVRALQSMAELNSERPVANGTPQDVYAGRAAMSLGTAPAGHGWPDGEESGTEDRRFDPAIGAEVDWAELPGTDEVFHPSLGQWQSTNRAIRRVTLLGSGGRLIAVTRSTRNAASAFRLLGWLASGPVSDQLGSASPATVPCRRSQLVAAERWFDPIFDRSASSAVAQVLQDALSRETPLVIPRIPGIDEYLASLQTAVEAVFQESAAPERALADAARQWESITDRHGRQQQQRAYLRHLNLSE